MSDEEVSVIEQELLDATKYKPKKGAKREDYLAGLVKAVEKMDEDDFDGLSDAAADWYNSAVEAMNDKETPPEFADAGEEATDEDVEADGEEAKTDSDDDDSSTDDDDDVASTSSESDDEEGTSDADEAEEEAAPPPKKAKTGRPPKASKKEKPKSRPEPERYAKITGEKDRFGIIKGTKTADAVAMYARPQGATAAQINEALGGRFYNITRKLAADGHHVEKAEGGVIKIIHKDDYGKKAKAGGKKGGK